MTTHETNLPALRRFAIFAGGGSHPEFKGYEFAEDGTAALLSFTNQHGSHWSHLEARESEMTFCKVCPKEITDGPGELRGYCCTEHEMIGDRNALLAMRGGRAMIEGAGAGATISDIEAACIDAIANILHFAHSQEIDCEGMVETAEMHFLAEAIDPDDFAVEGAKFDVYESRREREETETERVMAGIQQVGEALRNDEARRDATPDAKATCDNCGAEWPLDQLEDIKDYSMRVDEDGPEPDGQCPDCGALCYVVVQETPIDIAGLNWINEHAIDEGWAIFECCGSKGPDYQLQRDDEAGIFPTDTAAYLHVKAQAAAGHELHLRALDWLRTYCPEEIEEQEAEAAKMERRPQVVRKPQVD